MFLLSIVTFVWTLFFVGAWFLSLLLWGDVFVLKSAEIVVCHHDGGLRTEEPGGTMHAIDVMKEMMLLPTRKPVRVKLLSRIMNLAFRGDLRSVLGRYGTTVSPNPRIRKAPLCFLDIRYTTSKGPDPSKTYRCLYPIYSLKDYVYYPPKPTPSLASSSSTSSSTSSLSTSSSSTTSSSSSSKIASAVLTLRYNGDMARQVSCKVTEHIRALEGPFGDFHRFSGYQLQRPILKVVLMQDINALARSVETPDNNDSYVHVVNNTSGNNHLSSESSSSSLESFHSHKSANGLTSSSTSTSSLPVSIRLQFRMTDNRVKVIQLENQ